MSLGNNNFIRTLCENPLGSEVFSSQTLLTRHADADGQRSQQQWYADSGIEMHSCSLK